jgi:hypothetical protein
MDDSRPGPLRCLLYAHIALLVLVGFVASAAIVAASVRYADEPEHMVLASIASTVGLAVPLVLVGYPLIVRALLRRAGHAISRRRLVSLTASLLISAALAVLVTVGPQTGTGEADSVDLFLVALACGWVGSLLAQLGVASLMTWEGQVRRTAHQSLAPRAERRAAERAARKSQHR